MKPWRRKGAPRMEPTMTAEREKSQILLIDDDTSLLVMLSDFLRFEGYDVAIADSAEEGLKRLKEVAPDLIILDMSMPGMGGIGFLRAISGPSGKPKYPVLVLTARANMAEFFADVDVDGFIAKPCDTDDLLMEVGRIIFLRRGNQATERVSASVDKLKVLIGEDDETICRRLIKGFVDRGFVVDSAPTGPELLEKAIVGRPHLIVTKLVFKGMNGDAVANMLKEMPNTMGIPIILYDDSGLADPSGGYVGTGAIRRFVADSTSASLTAAAREVLHL